MIGRRPEPVIGKLAGSWGSVGNSGSATSPRSPLEIMKIQSPKGPKKYDFVGGVGLGIVAALEKSEQVCVSHHHKQNKPVFARKQSRSNPVSIEINEEDYTFVTCHGPNQTNASTKVYYDRDDHYGGATRTDNNIGFHRKSVKKLGGVIFEISPSRSSGDAVDFPDSNFLSFCHLCRKTLDGKDIYMYRGEKAFCSAECRYVEITKDERKEKQQCNSKLVASRSNTTNHVYPAANRLAFATGILAT